MTTRNKIQAIQSVKSFAQRKARKIYQAKLGNNSGLVDHPSRPDFVYIRLHSDPNQSIEAYAAASFPHQADVPVDVEIVKRTGASYYQVIGVSASVIYSTLDAWYPGIPGFHGWIHQRRDRNTGGPDPVDIYNRALVNLRARAQTVPDLTCYVERGFYVITSFKEFAGGNSPAFTAPAGAFSTQRWDLLYLGNDDALHVLQGTAAPINPTYPTVPANCIPIAYVILSNSSTTITESMITDARTILSSNQATATAHNILSAVHTDTLADTIVDGDILIGNATPRLSRLAISIPAANVRNVLGVDNGELRPSWKTALDATEPTTISVGAAASAGTSLVFSHCDHTHGAPATWTPENHDMITAHTYTDGAALDVFGLSAPSTIARLTPSAAGAASAHLLCTDADGGTRVTSLLVGLASALSAGQIWAAGEVTSVNASGALAAKIAIYHNNATGDYKLSLVPANLTDNRTVTFSNATGTVPLLESANIFTATQTISNTAPTLVMTDTTASAKSLTVEVDANKANLRESAGAAGSLLVLDLANNRVGIGNGSPGDMVVVGNTTTGGNLRFYSSSYGSNGLLRMYGTDGNEKMQFGSLSNTLAYIYTGSGIDLDVYTGGAQNYKFTAKSQLKIGSSAERGTTEGTMHIDLFNGTAPVGTLTNGISIYSSGGECYIMDAAGNATLQSPHDKDGRWIFHSKDTLTGKVLHVDMERMVKAINEKFGWDFVKEYVEN